MTLLALSAVAEGLRSIGDAPVGPIVSFQSGGDAPLRTSLVFGLDTPTEPAVYDQLTAVVRMGLDPSLLSLNLWGDLDGVNASKFSGGIASISLSSALWSLTANGLFDTEGQALGLLTLSLGSLNIQASDSAAFMSLRSGDGGLYIATVQEADSHGFVAHIGEQFGSRMYPGGENEAIRPLVGLTTAVVPEPSTLCLIALGFGLLIGRMRWKRLKA